MFSEFDRQTKNYSYKANEVLAKGILLPANAPAEFADRENLWNAVEKSEKQWNAQLARDFIIALPRELPEDQYELLMRDYCQQQFVSQGMIADYAIHDKGDGNPHAHIMLTMRAIDERGNGCRKQGRFMIRMNTGTESNYLPATTKATRITPWIGTILAKQKSGVPPGQTL